MREDTAGLADWHIALSHKMAMARSARDAGEADPLGREIEMAVSARALRVLLTRWRSVGTASKRSVAKAQLYDLALAAPEIRQSLRPPTAAPQARPRPERFGDQPCRHGADVLVELGEAAYVLAASAQWQLEGLLLSAIFAGVEVCVQVQAWMSRCLDTLAARRAACS